MKEYRVYVLRAGKLPNMSGYHIDDWNDYQKRHKKIPKIAKDYIKKCEEIGSVYSLHGFQDAFNIEESIDSNDYIFITKYY